MFKSRGNIDSPLSDYVIELILVFTFFCRLTLSICFFKQLIEVKSEFLLPICDVKAAYHFLYDYACLLCLFNTPIVEPY